MAVMRKNRRAYILKHGKQQLGFIPSKRFKMKVAKEDIKPNQKFTWISLDNLTYDQRATLKSKTKDLAPKPDSVSRNPAPDPHDEDRDTWPVIDGKTFRLSPHNGYAKVLGGHSRVYSKGGRMQIVVLRRCPDCHSAYTYLTTQPQKKFPCPACIFQRQAEYRAEHRLKNQAYLHAYYLKHKTRLLAKAKEYYYANPELMKQRIKKYRAERKADPVRYAHLLEWQVGWRKKNRAKISKSQQEYHERNPHMRKKYTAQTTKRRQTDDAFRKKCNAAVKKSYLKHRERRLAQARKHYKENKGRILAHNRAYRNKPEQRAKAIEYNKKYYHAHYGTPEHKAKAAARQKKYRDTHPDYKERQRLAQKKYKARKKADAKTAAEFRERSRIASAKYYAKKRKARK